MPRLFIAIDMPEEVKTPLIEFPPELPVASWVKSEQLHLTLRFLGEVSEKTFGEIKRVLSKVRFAPFPLTLCRVGHFPPRKHPRVLWVGIDPCEALMRLQQDIELALIEANIQPDQRPFSPHITLARLKDTPPSAVAEFEHRHHDLSCEPFEVREFILYSSILKHQGAVHQKEVVHHCEEGPAAPR